MIAVARLTIAEISRRPSQLATAPATCPTPPINNTEPPTGIAVASSPGLAVASMRETAATGEHAVAPKAAAPATGSVADGRYRQRFHLQASHVSVIVDGDEGQRTSCRALPRAGLC